MSEQPVDPENWIEAYAENFQHYDDAADIASGLIREVLLGEAIAIHQVMARAKSVSSARAKLLEKKYAQPSVQMTDLLGVRVITTYEHGVKASTDAIRDSFRIDEQNSIDKTSKLGDDKFGYRGVHLIATVPSGIVNPAGQILQSHKVEIQIRSVVEHAWAEIDHELRYKSGIPFTPELDRRFNAVAGTLEMVDREFTAIVKELVSGVAELASQFERTGITETVIDTTVLLAILQLRRPGSPGLGPGGVKLKLGVARDFVGQLSKAGIETASALETAIAAQPVRNAIHDYAVDRRITPSAVSASAVLAIVLGLKNPELLAHTELSKDRPLLKAIQTAT